MSVAAKKEKLKEVQEKKVASNRKYNRQISDLIRQIDVEEVDDLKKICKKKNISMEELARAIAESEEDVERLIRTHKANSPDIGEKEASEKNEKVTT